MKMEVMKMSVMKKEVKKNPPVYHKTSVYKHLANKGKVL